MHCHSCSWLHVSRPASQPASQPASAHRAQRSFSAPQTQPDHQLMCASLRVCAQGVWSRALGLPIERPKSLTVGAILEKIGA